MNLLFVVHNYIGYGKHWGGTETHVRDIVERFRQRKDHRLYVLLHSGTPPGCYVLLDVRNNSQERFVLDTPIHSECYRHEEFENAVRSLLSRHQIDVVHFFHLIHFPLSFPLIAQQAGAKVVVAFFDYYGICPQWNLMSGHTVFCRYPRVSLETCDLCLKKTFGYPPGTQGLRRQLISEILYHADALHVLCQDELARMLAAYPHLADKPTLTMGLGQDRPPQAGGRRAALPMADEAGAARRPLRVACIGNFVYWKGADLLIQIMDYYGEQHPSPVEFHVYGNQSPPYDAALKQRAENNEDLVHLYGGYSPEQLPELVKDCDVALFAFIWPETFVLVLSEAWSCGLVPVAPRIGALGERITDGETGFLYDLDDPGSALRILDDLARNRHKLDACREAIREVSYPSVEDNVCAYLALYEQVREAAENNVERAAGLGRLALSARPEDWRAPARRFVVEPRVRERSLLRRAWRVYRKRGLRHTVVSSFQYVRWMFLR